MRFWSSKFSFQVNNPQTASGGLRWPQMASDGLGWPQMASDGLRWPQMASDGLRFQTYQSISQKLLWSFAGVIFKLNAWVEPTSPECLEAPFLSTPFPFHVKKGFEQVLKTCTRMQTFEIKGGQQWVDFGGPFWTNLRVRPQITNCQKPRET